MAGNRITTTARVGTGFRINTDNQGPLDCLVDPPAIIAILTNLTREVWVDVGTPVALADQNGNIETPFATITAAVAALQATGGLIHIVPGDYTAEGTIDCNALAGPTVFQSTVQCTTWRETQILAPAISALDFSTSTAGTVAAFIGLQYASIYATGLVGAIFDSCASSANTNFAGITTCRQCFLQGIGGAVCGDLTFIGVLTTGSGITFLAGATVLIQDTDLAANFAMVGAGQIRLDNYSWWSAQANNVTTGTAEVVLDIPDPAQLRSSTDLALSADGLQNFGAYTFGELPKLAASQKYLIEYSVQVPIWTDADHSIVGQIDFTIQASIVTDGSAIATVTFDTVPVPNISYLPAGLAGASANIVASANGWTVQAQRPTGVACHARYFVEWERVDNVT